MSTKQEGCLSAIIILVIGIPLSGALYAWAAQLNWNWFATTLGAQRVGFWQAYGIGLVVASFTSHNAEKGANSKESTSDLVFRMFAYIITRFVVLAGCGLAAHHFMGPA
jgi:hypothetical protein